MERRMSFFNLNPREREVLLLLAEDKTSAEIAQAKARSASTIGNQVSRMIAKFRADSREHLVFKAAEAGLIDPLEYVSVLQIAAYENLSSRQQEILAALAAVGSDKAIARRHGLTGHTIKSHLANIRRTLGASRLQAGLVHHAVQKLRPKQPVY